MTLDPSALAGFMLAAETAERILTSICHGARTVNRETILTRYQQRMAVEIAARRGYTEGTGTVTMPSIAHG